MQTGRGRQTGNSTGKHSKHRLSTASTGRLITINLRSLLQTGCFNEGFREESCRPDGNDQQGPKQAVPLTSRRAKEAAAVLNTVTLSKRCSVSEVPPAESQTEGYAWSSREAPRKMQRDDTSVTATKMKITQTSVGKIWVETAL